jgi:hypothetical protein
MRLLVLALFVFSAGCDDGDDGSAADAGMGGAGGVVGGAGGAAGGAGGTPEVREEHITANIDGEPFAAQLVVGEVSDGELRFQSDQSQQRQMFFVLPDDIEAGSYPLSAEGEGPHTAKYGEIFDGIFPTESGTIVIDGIDRETQWIWGSFDFVGAQDTFGEITRVEVTEGSFAVEYRIF